jgi:CheY-like chemotaxis protein
MSASKRVLIIDDDQYIRELYEEILKSDGSDVETAVDGEQGLSMMQKGGYDLILLDVMMPKLDGVGVLTKLQDNPPKEKNGPIVLLTNLAFDPVINEAMQKGAKAVLIKTDYNPGSFLTKIKEYLK